MIKDLKNDQLSKDCGNCVWPFEKRRRKKWVVYSVFGMKKTTKTNIRYKQALFTCNGDQDWCDSRLLWLEIVLLCLYEVGLKWVSWPVKYLDKPQRTTVRCALDNTGVPGIKKPLMINLIHNKLDWHTSLPGTYQTVLLHQVHSKL